MRRKLIAGNWKMNGFLKDGVKLAKDINQKIAKMKYNADVLICPPFTLLAPVKEAIRDSNIMLGAQDCYFAPNGAHTGDISAKMLKNIGCDYVILGHSERRLDHYEKNALIRKKAKAAIEAGLRVIICVGETEKERRKGLTLEVIEKQVLGSIPGQSTWFNTVIAYEPVWAIGTGKTATPADAEEIHAHIRKILTQKRSKGFATHIKILYGGSMKPTNAAELLAEQDIDGGLIGGASLKADDFVSIIDKTAVIDPEQPIKKVRKKKKRSKNKKRKVNKQKTQDQKTKSAGRNKTGSTN